MSIQYSDNVFSGNMPFGEALEKFKECIENGIPVQALHFGTEEELNRRKKKANLESEIKELKARMDAFEPGPKSELIHIPVAEEIEKLKKKNFGK